MTQSSPQIVHESESQRQFVRIRMPAKVGMNGEIYALRDLSSGGLAVLDVDGTFEKGKVVSMELILPFNDFTLDVQLEAQIQNFDAPNKTIGARFINLSKQQISLLNHVIKSFIAGDVVEGGDILSVVARDNFVRVRKQDGSSSETAAPKLSRQAIPLFFIVLLGVLGALTIGNSVYQSAFTIKTPDGVVEGETVNLTSTQDGHFKSSLAEGAISVKTGEVVGTISTVFGKEIPVSSPCDCFIFETLAKDGEQVKAGQALATLAPTDGDPIVKVQMDTVTVQRLKMSAIPTISIAGDAFDRTGRIIEIKSSLSGNSNSTAIAGFQAPFVNVTIRANQRIPADLIGRPAQVTFKTY
jgi:alginate biosynthesis protein Alg44